MPAPRNLFKEHLFAGKTQIGLWISLGHPSVAELATGCGYDWLVIDGEHGPNGLRDVLAQLRAVGQGAHPVVRTRDDDRAIIKQMLDIGTQTLLIPMIESGDQAREAVRSVLYPPEGARGVGAMLARASGYGSVPDYLTTADDQICLLLQVENRTGLAALDDILSIPRVDGIFIGPADLAADMGHLGNPAAEEVQIAVEDALSRIRAAGKAAGILSADRSLTAGYVEKGIEFVAVGSDVGVLRGALDSLRRSFP
ncbi:aldolase/citrate lyase family protein [Palleronia sp.]|uniref:aldolase/citrate lyase family protein n=1 Tax=Palleronia sp. TaxID=1940284 RepID=UPI0035C78E11